MDFLRKNRYTLIALCAVLAFLFYPNIGIYDWEKEIMYCEVIRQSLLEGGTFPMFLWNSGRFSFYPAIAQSAFFPGNPETMLFSPLMPLLLILPSITFLKLIVLINFLMGWAGMHALSRSLSWDARKKRLFSALFFLSPIVFQHVAIGYLPWINLYLLPWLFYFMLGDGFLRKSLGSAAVLAFMLLQGGLHVCVWAGFILAFYSLFQAVFKKQIQPLMALITTSAASAVLALPRLFASYGSFSGFEQRFFSGYSLSGFLKWALIPPFFTPRTMDDIEFFIEEYIDGVPYWDGNLFWGFLLVCAALLPLVFWLMHRKKKPDAPTGQHINALAISLTAGILLLSSFDGLYASAITFIADLIHLHALKGMEKYPFRFAIPAYFTFALVTAWLWDELLRTFSFLVDKLRIFFTLVWQLMKKIGCTLRPHRKWLIWISAVFVLACIGLILFRGAVLDQVNNMVTSAYKEEGASIFSGMMANTDTIPLGAYLSKAAMLYQYLTRFLVAGSALLFGLVFFTTLQQDGQMPSRQQSKRAHAFLNWLPEVLLILPMLLAFGMWWRVSLATPIGNAEPFTLQPPTAAWMDEDGDQAPPVIISSPDALEIEVTESMIARTLLFPDIPGRDVNQLEITAGNAELMKVGGKTAVLLVEEGMVEIRARYYPLAITRAISGTGWFILAGLCFRYRKKERWYS